MGQYMVAKSNTSPHVEKGCSCKKGCSSKEVFVERSVRGQGCSWKGLFVEMVCSWKRVFMEMGVRGNGVRGEV